MMNSTVEKCVFNTNFENDLPFDNLTQNKQYQMRQRSFKDGHESDSSLESVDLNISDFSKTEHQKSESPKRVEENTSSNIYKNKKNLNKGLSLDRKKSSEDEKQELGLENLSLSPRTKSSKKLVSKLSFTNFDTSFTSRPFNQQSFTNNSSSVSSPATSPASVSSQTTFKLSPQSSHRNSVFDDLLFEIYNRWCVTNKSSFDSDTFTDVTENDGMAGNKEKNDIKISRASLENRNVQQLSELVSQLKSCSNQLSGRLVKYLRSREKQMAGLREKYDIMTAYLQASSHKTREDSKLRFSIEPMPGEEAFQQWKAAMRAVSRLPGGVPNKFRKKVWLALADNYLGKLCIDWNKTRKFAFNDRINPDDSKLGLQIVKDLHRTGCSRFSGRENEQDRAVLKRVLLAYARWNKKVGYCQGFNILAALILGVVDWQEDAALKVMIYMVDKVLPENYFANNLRSLSVDIAVFRDLLRIYLPRLSKHLDALQTQASSDNTYEPPLTNVFTMQWLLTMYATCFSPPTTLRLWDCILLEGSEILLRAGVVIWEKLQIRILSVNNASEFYCLMGSLSQQMLNDDVLDAEDLVKRIFSIAPYPLPHLAEMREKFTYNITPFRASTKGLGDRSVPRKSLQSASSLMTSPVAEEDEWDNDDLGDSINCFGGIFSMQNNMAGKTKEEIERVDISKLSPGAYTAHPTHASATGALVLSERASLDLEMLKKQYKKVMQRQRKAHLILAAVQEKKISNDPLTSQNTMLKAFTNHQLHAPTLQLSPPAINHLLASRELLNTSKKNQTVLPITNFLQTRFGFKRSLKHIDQRLKKLEKQKKNINDSSKKEMDKQTSKEYNQPSSKPSEISEPVSSLKNTEHCVIDRSVSLSSVSSSSISFKHLHDEGNDTDTTFEPSHPWCEASKLNQQNFDHIKFFEENGVKIALESGVKSKVETSDEVIKEEKSEKNENITIENLKSFECNTDLLNKNLPVEKSCLIESYIDQSISHLNSISTPIMSYANNQDSLKENHRLDSNSVKSEKRLSNSGSFKINDEKINVFNDKTNTFTKNQSNSNDISKEQNSKVSKVPKQTGLHDYNNKTINKLDDKKVYNKDNLNSSHKKDSVVKNAIREERTTKSAINLLGKMVSTNSNEMQSNPIERRGSDLSRDGSFNRASIAFNPFPRSVCSVRRKSQVGVQLGMYRCDEGDAARRKSSGDGAKLKAFNPPITNSAKNMKSQKIVFKLPNEPTSNKVAVNMKNNTNSAAMKVVNESEDYRKIMYNACLHRQYLATVSKAHHVKR